MSLLGVTTSLLLHAAAFDLGWNVPCAPPPELSTLETGGKAVATVVPRDSRWRLELVFLEPAPGVRTLDTDTCLEAAEAVPLLLKLGAVPVPQSKPPLEPPPSVATPAPAATMPAPSKSVGLTLDFGGGASLGSSPAVAPRLGVTLGVEPAWLTVLATLRTGVPATYTGSLEGSSFSLHPALGAQLAACALPRVGRLTLGGCLVVGGEWWRAAGLDVDQPRSASAFSAAAGLDARFTVQVVSGLYLFASVGGRGALRRLSIEFQGASQPAFVSAPVWAEGLAGVGWRFATE